MYSYFVVVDFETVNKTDAENKTTKKEMTKMKTYIKTLLAIATVAFLGTSAQAAETENITLMASETAPAITTTATALKWYVTKDDTATERLDIKVERLVDSTAKVTITANGTTAGDKVAVLGLYGDGDLVKTINVTITEKEDVAEFEQHVAIGETWTRTTVTKKAEDNQNWRFNVNPNSYKATDNNYNTIAKLATYFDATVTGNADGTATASIKGVAPADGKTFIIDLQYGRNRAYTTVQTITVVVDPAVADIKIPLNGSVETNGTYGTSTQDGNRHWVYNDLTVAGVVGLSLKKGNNNNFTVSDFSAPTGYEAYTKQTDWYHTFKATLTGNAVGADTVYIGRFYNGKDFVSECYKYNVYVYENKTTNITMTAGDTLPVVFESEAAGAWEVEGLAENDETVTLSAYAGWTDTSFETAITAKKVTEEAKIFKVKNNFCIYTVNLTVEQGTEIKDVSVAKGGEYNDTIEGPGTPSTDDESVATIGLSGNTVTITGVAAGDAVCTVNPGYQYNVTVYETKTENALVGLGKTANIDCTSDFEGAWTAQLAEGAEEGVVQIGNEWGESSTEFRLQLKGLKKGKTVVLVKNAYAQYTINVEVSEQIENIELSMKVDDIVNTNLTWETAAYWTAVSDNEDVATVTVGSGETAATDAKVEAKKAGNAQWTVYVGATAGAMDYAAYTMNIKVWEDKGAMPVDLLPKETKTLNLTSAAAASWTAVSSDKNVATVTGSGVISTSFAPVITAGDVDEGSATITVQNDYVKYEIIVTVKDGFLVNYYDDNENVHTDEAKILTYETDLHIWDGDREGLELVGYKKENGEALEKSDEALRAYIKEEAEKPGCDGEVKVFGTWKKSGWNPETDPSVPASDMGIEGKLGQASFKTLSVWAQANGVEFWTGDKDADYLDAFLLNCDPDDSGKESEAYAIESITLKDDGSWEVKAKTKNTDGDDYNGMSVIYGSESIEDPDWDDTNADGPFFMAELQVKPAAE